MKKIWVIGADSFTGKYLLQALETDGYEVHSAEVDITDSKQVERVMLKIEPDYIINLAAISFVPDGEDASIYAVNTLGPQNILEACLKLPVAPKKIILASSANVYGTQNIELIGEEQFPSPINHYGCSKWAMEQIAKNYNGKLNIVVTRPFNYTGKGQEAKFLIPKIVQHFKDKSETISLGNIDIWRDFSDVRWIAKAYLALLSEQVSSPETVNLCSGKMTSIREVIDYLQELTSHKITVEVNAEFVRKTDIERQCGDNGRLFSVLPNLESPIAIKETLKWMMS